MVCLTDCLLCLPIYSDTIAPSLTYPKMWKVHSTKRRVDKHADSEFSRKNVFSFCLFFFVLVFF